MTENNLNNTNVNISTASDRCAKAELQASSNVEHVTNISLQSSSQLRANATQKEVSVRITSKNRMLKVNDVNTF